MINIGVVGQTPAKGMIAVEIESRFGDSTAHAMALLIRRPLGEPGGSLSKGGASWTASLQARLELAAPTDP